MQPDENLELIDGLTEQIQDRRLPKQGPDSGNTGRRHRSMTVGIVLSVVIHATALWLLIVRPPTPPTLLPPGSDNSVTVYLTPTPSAPAQPPTPPQPQARAAPQPKSAPPPRAARPAQPRKPPAPIAPPAVVEREAPRQIQPAPPAPSAPPADDMFTQLEAARKRRAEAQGRDSSPAQESEARDPNSIARANVAESLKRASGPNRKDSGGVFQVRHLGFRDATFVFHGWSAASRRDVNQLITVELGAEKDIQTAVVKKMIDIIRAQTNDTFIWDSHRLGKQLTLSARREDSAELQQFLMREFFPDYVRH